MKPLLILALLLPLLCLAQSPTPDLAKFRAAQAREKAARDAAEAERKAAQIRREIQARQKPPLQTTADLLVGAYEANEVLCDKLIGKRIIVSGMVSKVAKDITGKPFVLLDTSHLFGVQCMFTENDLARLAALKIGH